MSETKKENACENSSGKKRGFHAALYRMCDSTYKKISECLLAKLMFLTGSLGNKVSGSWLASHVSGLKIKRNVVNPVKKYFTKEIEQSFLVTKFNSVISLIKKLQIKIIGTFLFSLGFYVLIIQLLKNYLKGGYVFEPTSLIYGLMIIIASIPLLFSSGKSISRGICESKIMSLVLFRILGLIREDFEKDETVIAGNSIIAFIAGMIFSIITIWLNPIYLLAAIVGIIFVLIVFYMPEVGVSLIFLALPFLTTMMLAALVVMNIFAFGLKVLRGKRSIKIGFTDTPVILFVILLLLGGIFSVSPAGSIKPALVFICFIGAYFLITNLIRTRAWILRCAGMTIFSSFVVSAIGVAEYFTGGAKMQWIDQSLFDDISGRVVSTFGNPNVLAEYLILTIPLVVVFMFRQEKFRNRIAALMLCGISALCLIFTWSRGAWVGFAIGFVVLILMYSRKSLIVVISGIACLPFASLMLPSSVWNRLSSIGNLADTSTFYRVNIWIGSIKMAFNNLLSGIGIGEAAFAKVYPKYSLAGCETAPHSHSLFLQTLIEIGLPGLLVFIALIFILLSKAAVSLKNNPKPDETVRLVLLASIAGLISILAQGTTDYVWYNYRVFLMFWLTAGFCTASARCISSDEARNEAKSAYSADIDLIYSIKQTKNVGRMDTNGRKKA